MNEYQGTIQTDYDNLMDKIRDNQTKESQLAARKDNIRELFKKYNVASMEYQHIIPDSPSKDPNGDPEIIKQSSGMKNSLNTQSMIDPKTLPEYQVHYMSSDNPIQIGDQSRQGFDFNQTSSANRRLLTPPGLLSKNNNGGYRPRPRVQSNEGTILQNSERQNPSPRIEANSNWRPRLSHNPMMTHQSTFQDQNRGQEFGINHKPSPIHLPNKFSSNVTRHIIDHDQIFRIWGFSL